MTLAASSVADCDRPDRIAEYHPQPVAFAREHARTCAPPAAWPTGRATDPAQVIGAGLRITPLPVSG